MKNYHVIKRGSKYHFVCRVPKDLQHFFPVTTIYRSLKTGDKKIARLLAATFEHNTQGVFMKLRSGHFDANATRQLIISYFGMKRDILEAKLRRKVYSDQEDTTHIERHQLNIINEFAPYAEKIDLLSVGQAQLGARAALRENELRTAYINGELPFADDAQALAKQHGFRKLSPADQEALQQRMLEMEIKLAGSERAARQDFDFSKFDDFTNYLAKEKAQIKPRFYLKNIIDDYLALYDAPDCTIKLNSLRAVKREVTFILTALGNMELHEFNSKAGLERLNRALNKKMKSTGAPLSEKTKADHVKRLSSLVGFVIDKNELAVTNNIIGKYKTGAKNHGPAKSSQEGSRQKKKRNGYDREDSKKLEQALCTQPMTYYKTYRNDRFWIALIAILQGFRKSAIVNMRERNIIIDKNSNLMCFDPTIDMTSNDKPINSCPIHPLLIQTGFLEWFEKTKTGNPNRKLFEDDPESFGQWWNGCKDNGWDRHITDDPKKTFHSLRHYFCCWTEQLRIPVKERNEMSCHSIRHVDNDVRSTHYLERVRIEQMHHSQKLSLEPHNFLMTDFDWERLRKRAEELFDLK